MRVFTNGVGNVIDFHSKSYPYFALSYCLGIDYGEVLKFVDELKNGLYETIDRNELDLYWKIETLRRFEEMRK